MKEIDFRTESDIESSISRIEKLLESKILENSNPNLFKNSVLIEVVILLRDLLEKSEFFLDKRVSFVDDVDIDKKVKDVKDLIKFFRDTFCHIESKDSVLETNTLKFNTSYGKGSMIINGVVIGGKYNDDVSFNMGGKVLYLKRHIYRVFKELKDNFKEMI